LPPIRGRFWKILYQGAPPPPPRNMVLGVFFPPPRRDLWLRPDKFLLSLFVSRRSELFPHFKAFTSPQFSKNPPTTKEKVFASSFGPPPLRSPILCQQRERTFRPPTKWPPRPPSRALLRRFEFPSPDHFFFSSSVPFAGTNRIRLIALGR